MTNDITPDDLMTTVLSGLSDDPEHPSRCEAAIVVVSELIRENYLPEDARSLATELVGRALYARGSWGVAAVDSWPGHGPPTFRYWMCPSYDAAWQLAAIVVSNCITRLDQAVQRPVIDALVSGLWKQAVHLYNAALHSTGGAVRVERLSGAGCWQDDELRQVLQLCLQGARELNKAETGDVIYD